MAIAAGNALLALASAAAWGGGDFAGGMGVKAAGEAAEFEGAPGSGGFGGGALRMVIVAHAVSLGLLVVVLAVVGAAVPRGALLAWGLAAGVGAAFALTAFYVALSRGAMGAPAAVSGLIATSIPVLVSITTEGRPTGMKLAGFGLAAAAIWLIAAGASAEGLVGGALEGPRAGNDRRVTMGLAVFGGLGFGFYMVALRMANPLGVFEPMALARAASLVTCALMLLAVQRGKVLTTSGGVWLSRGAVAGALGVALLDTGGNLLFLAATRLGRLDVAAVLASLYPASTIGLAAWRLKERPTRRQVAGMVVALVAVVMIAA